MKDPMLLLADLVAGWMLENGIAQPKEVLCERCAVEGTSFMTACCHRPLCLGCHDAARIDDLTEQVYRPQFIMGHKLTGSYVFTCPFCQQSKYVTDYDADSNARFMSLAAGDEEPVILIPIEENRKP